MKNRTGYLLLVAGLVVIFGCTSKVDRSMVVGKYYANYKNAVEILELKPDGSYEYYFKSPANFEIRHSNRWEFGYEDGIPIITFDQFVFGFPAYGAQIPGFWRVEVERSFWARNLRLGIEPDVGYYFEKK